MPDFTEHDQNEVDETAEQESKKYRIRLRWEVACALNSLREVYKVDETPAYDVYDVTNEVLLRLIDETQERGFGDVRNYDAAKPMREAFHTLRRVWRRGLQ